MKNNHFHRKLKLSSDVLKIFITTLIPIFYLIFTVLHCTHSLINEKVLYKNILSCKVDVSVGVNLYNLEERQPEIKHENVQWLVLKPCCISLLLFFSRGDCITQTDVSVAQGITF